jgi:hypothetical protein
VAERVEADSTKVKSTTAIPNSAGGASANIANVGGVSGAAVNGHTSHENSPGLVVS